MTTHAVIAFSLSNQAFEPRRNPPLGGPLESLTGRGPPNRDIGIEFQQSGDFGIDLLSSTLDHMKDEWSDFSASGKHPSAGQGV